MVTTFGGSGTSHAVANKSNSVLKTAGRLRPPGHRVAEGI